MLATELIIKFFDNYYGDPEHPAMFEYKEKLIEITLQNTVFLKGTEEEKAIQAINNIGNAFSKVIKFNYVPLSKEDFHAILNA